MKEDRQKQDVSKYNVYLFKFIFTNSNQCTLHDIVQVHSHYQLIANYLCDCMIAQQCFDGEGG